MALEFAAEDYAEKMQNENENRSKGIETDREVFSDVDIEMFTQDSGKEKEWFILNTGELVKYLTEKKLEGVRSGELAYIFHKKLAALVIAGCKVTREKTKCNCVALSGGVFQNRLLLQLVEEGLEQESFTVLRHHLIPANDGGIALGQAAYAMQYIQEEK